MKRIKISLVITVAQHKLLLLFPTMHRKNGSFKFIVEHFGTFGSSYFCSKCTKKYFSNNYEVTLVTILS